MMRMTWISDVLCGFARTAGSLPRLAVGVAATFLAAGLAGCVAQVDTHGERVDPDRLSAIHPGVQRRDDVAELLGSPSSTAVFGDETWYYIGDVVETRSIFDRDVVSREVVIIRFDQSGVVKDVDMFGMERGKEVELVERQTPSFGESVNIIQQLLGNLGKFNRPETPQRR